MGVANNKSVLNRECGTVQFTVGVSLSCCCCCGVEDIVGGRYDIIFEL